MYAASIRLGAALSVWDGQGRRGRPDPSDDAHHLKGYHGLGGERACPARHGVIGDSDQPIQPSVVIAHSFFQLIRILVNLIDRRNSVSGLIFSLIKYPDVLLVAIEVKAADGFAVIVV